MELSRRVIKMDFFVGDLIHIPQDTILSTARHSEVGYYRTKEPSVGIVLDKFDYTTVDVTANVYEVYAIEAGGVFMVSENRIYKLKRRKNVNPINASD